MKTITRTLQKYSKYLLIILFLLLYASTSHAQNTEKGKDERFDRAVKYFYEKKFEMAELLLQETLKQNPENQLAYSYLGDIFLRKKRYDGALQLYRKALDIKPNNGENYFRIAQIYYYKKMGDLAIENFKKSFDINPRIKFAFYHMGLTHLMILRDKQNTISNWEKYLTIAPEDPQYEKIRRAIELLKDPNFIIPPVGSDIAIEEALHLGGGILKDAQHQAEDKKAGHEKKKTKNKIEDIYRDDGL